MIQAGQQTITVGQTVQTPNGRGVFQHWIRSNGGLIAMVSHAPGMTVDREKCRSYVHMGGPWQLVGYDAEKVSAI